MFDYYYRGSNEEEVTIQVANNRLCIRVTEDDGQTTALVELPWQEIEQIRMGLIQAEKKIRK
jgi:hypothetical protein